MSCVVPYGLNACISSIGSPFKDYALGNTHSVKSIEHRLQFIKLLCCCYVCNVLHQLVVPCKH